MELKMKLEWTKPYCGIQYVSNIPKQHHISVAKVGDEGMARAIHMDLRANDHIHQSNFNPDRHFYGEFDEVIKVAEEWANEYLK
jgi:hypothetical protein